MKANYLYYFVLNEITHPPFVNKTDSFGEKYLLHALPLMRKTVIATRIKSYEVTDHHLSIYKDQKKHGNCRSQYHYTASLRDEKHEHYHLHIYFDQNDRILVPVDFALVTEDKQIKVILTEELTQKFSNLAISESVDLITALRCRHQTKLQELKTRYAELETQLANFSASSSSHRKLYVKKIDRLIEILTILASYDHAHANHTAIIKLFMHIQQHVPTQPMLLPENEEEIHEEEKEILPATSQAILPQQPSLHTLVKHAQHAKEQFEAIVDTKDPSLDFYVQKTSAFHHWNHCQAELLLAANEKAIATLSDLQSIEYLLTAYTKSAKQLLTRVLLANRYDLGLQLRQFLDPAPDDLVRLALRTNNGILLDFLLTHGHFPINTFTVDNGLNPVQFCFEKHSDATPKLQCLSVLIKQGASLAVPANDGIPIGYYITRQGQPTENVMVENAECTFLSKAFYQALLHACDKQLSRIDLSTETKTKLETVKHHLLKERETCKSTEWVLPEIYKEAMKEHMAAEADPNEHLFRLALEKDNEVTTLRRERNELSKHVLQRIRAEIPSRSYRGTSIFHYLKRAEQERPKEVYKTVEAYKKYIIESLRGEIKASHDMNRLLDCYGIFKQPGNQSNKDRTKLNNEYKEARARFIAFACPKETKQKEEGVETEGETRLLPPKN